MFNEDRVLELRQQLIWTLVFGLFYLFSLFFIQGFKFVCDLICLNIKFQSHDMDLVPFAFTSRRFNLILLFGPVNTLTLRMYPSLDVYFKVEVFSRHSCVKSR